MSNDTEPWYLQIDADDSNWIIASAFMIFTMQTGTLYYFINLPKHDVYV